jgi:ADP-heptose:LPS heptosyltransferase
LEISIPELNDPFSPGLLGRLAYPLQKVAILRASRIGDFICAAPAFRALRAALPGAEISVITLPVLKDLVDRSPYLDRFIPFPGFPGIAEQFFDPRQAAKFFQRMQSESFDLAIQMQGSGVYSNPFMLMLGAKKTAGFIRPGDPAGLLDAALPLPEHGHEIHRVLSMPIFLGAEPQGEAAEYPLEPEDHRRAVQLLAGANPPLIGLHAAARDRTRRWPLECFAAVGEALQRRWGGTILIFGEAEELSSAGRLAQSLPVPALNLSGRTSLGVLGGVLARLSVLVTNDTGPAHIAYALGTPTVTIFGGGELERYKALHTGPYRILAYPIPCRPCSYAECPIGYVCLENVTQAEVIAAAEQVMSPFL